MTAQKIWDASVVDEHTAPLIAQSTIQQLSAHGRVTDHLVTSRLATAKTSRHYESILAAVLAYRKDKSLYRLACSLHYDRAGLWCLLPADVRPSNADCPSFPQNLCSMRRS